MSGVTLAFDHQETLTKRWHAREAMVRPAPLLRAMGECLLAFHRQRFREQKSPQGIGWQALNPRYQRRKRKNQDKILTGDGYLRNTLRWQVGADALLFGTDRVYGAIHQIGGTVDIAARSQQAYYRQKKSGRIASQCVRKKTSNFTRWYTLAAHKITLPARPWLGVSGKEGDTLIEMTRRYLMDALH